MRLKDLNPKVVKDLVRLLTITIVVFMITTAICGSKWQATRSELADLKVAHETLKKKCGFKVHKIIESIEETAFAMRGPEVPQFVTVEKGDWLSKYAKWYLGDAKRWPEIWKLNPHIKNPNLIYPGQKVRIW